MGTPTQPEQENQEGQPQDQQGTPDQTPQPSSESSSPTTQPTPQPTGGATEPSPQYIALLEATIREQNARLQQALDNRAAPAAPAPAPAPAPVPNVEEERTAFFNDPINTNRRLIREELTQAIAPLHDFIRGMRGEGTPLSNIINKFKADPRFARALEDPQVVRATEDILSRPGVELNDANAQAAIVQANGLKAMGLLPSSTPTPQPAPAPTPAPQPAPAMTTPAHMRPSAAPTPQNNGQKKLRPLTELEERLRREQKMSHEDFLKWLDVRPEDVATADIGKPKPAGSK